MFFQHEISPVRILFLLLALLPGILACNRADAQTGPPPAVHSDSVIAGSAAAEESVPVAIPSPIAKAVQRYQTGNAWWAVLTAWGIVLPLLLLAGGYSAWAQKLAWRLGRRWYFSWCLYLLLILAAVYALNWPLSFYLGYIRTHAYGLSNQTFSRWFGDSLKEELVLYGAGVLFLW